MNIACAIFTLNGNILAIGIVNYLEKEWVEFFGKAN
jgi:hypothetical protein